MHPILRPATHLLSVLVILGAFVGMGALMHSHDVCAAHGGCSNGHNGGAGDGREGGGNGGNPPGGGGSPPRPCTLTLDKTLVASGTPTVLLSWTPTPHGSVNLRRGRDRITVPDSATTYTDSIASLPSGSYTYSVSFRSDNGSVRGVSTSSVEQEVNEHDAIEIKPVSSLLDVIRDFAFGFIKSVHASHMSPGGGGMNAAGNSGTADSGGKGDQGGHGGGPGAGTTSLGGTTAYACSATLTVVDKITECNDGVDNADSEDVLSDRFDPGCHTDGNPGNNSSYRPLDESEVNPPADMVPSISTATRTKARRPVSVTAGAENVATTAAAVNRLVYGWRNTSAGASVPKCGRASSAHPVGSRCFVQGGKTYTILNTYNQSYIGHQRRTAPSRSFRPLVAGRYEVCAVADYTNAIDEGVTGERNNSTCVPVIVDPEDTSDPPTPGPTITGPIEISVSPGRVRKGSSTAVTWNTNGREMCVITGSNGHIIDLTGESSSASEPTPAITSETVYVMECADDGAIAESKVGIVPIIQEI